VRRTFKLNYSSLYSWGFSLRMNPASGATSFPSQKLVQQLTRVGKAAHKRYYILMIRRSQARREVIWRSAGSLGCRGVFEGITLDQAIGVSVTKVRIVIQFGGGEPDAGNFDQRSHLPRRRITKSSDASAMADPLIVLAETS